METDTFLIRVSPHGPCNWRQNKKTSSALCPAGHVRVACLPAGHMLKDFLFVFFLSPIGIIAFFFFFFAGRYSPWLKEFNFHLLRGDIQFQTQAALWWALKREERCCWMQKKEASRSLSACLQSWRETFKHSFVAAAHRCGARLWIWLWLLCRALTAHPYTPALREQGDVVRNLLLEGHRSGTATLSSRTPSQTLIRQPDSFLSWPASVSSSCCLCWRSSRSCVWIVTLFMSPFTPTCLSRGCQPVSVSHLTPNGGFLSKVNWWRVGSAELDPFLATAPGANLNLLNVSVPASLHLFSSFLWLCHWDSLWTLPDTMHLCF